MSAQSLKTKLYLSGYCHQIKSQLGLQGFVQISLFYILLEEQQVTYYSRSFTERDFTTPIKCPEKSTGL